jgi:hypothetical protein
VEWDYLGAVLDRDFKQNDIVLMVSLDGAQLYKSKQLDCWMYVWVILNLSPDKCYQKIHVCPGGFIPGPNKPKNLDSFLIVGMHNLAALQNKGLVIWDASCNVHFISDLHLLFTTANSPGLVYWDGMVGHSSKNGCHVYCGVTGRQKMQGTHYYPAHLSHEIAVLLAVTILILMSLEFHLEDRRSMQTTYITLLHLPLSANRRFRRHRQVLQSLC